METEDKTDESYLADDYKRPQIYINQLFKLSKETNMFDDAAIADHIFTIIFGVGWDNEIVFIQYLKESHFRDMKHPH